MEAWQMQDYWNIRFFMYKEAMALKHITVIGRVQAPSKPLPFSMPSKLLILQGEAKSEFFQ